MSRVQSFTSMVAWPKSEFCNGLYMSYSRNVERTESERRLHNLSRAFRNSQAVADINWVNAQR